MPEDKKSKKNGVEKLRKVLDDISYKDLDSKDEKHIIALKSRLEESSERKIIYKKANETDEGMESLKPIVTIHERRVKKLVVELEPIKKVVEPVKEPVESLPEFKEAEKSQIEKEDLFEVKKVEVKVPEFIEVKPKTVEREDTSDLDEKSAIAGEKVEEWEPIETAKEETLEEKPSKAEEVEGKISNFCPYCGAKLGTKGKFCIYCGKNLITEVAKDERIPSFIPVEKKVEEEKVDEEVKKTEEIESLEEADLEREKKIDALKELNSVDEETAVLLYYAGYTSIDFLNLANVKDLSKIKGIKKKKAKEILKEMQEKSAKVEAIDLGETEKKEVTEEETKLEEEAISKDVKIEAFSHMSSIDDETAVLLFDIGYTSFDMLKNVTVDDLIKIDGIKKRKAKKIRKEIDKKIQESVRPKPIEMGDTAKGDVKEDQILKESEKYEEEKGKPSPVELRTKTSEWSPLDQDIELERKEELEELPKEVDLEREKKIEIFKGINSIDEETAVLLYNAGYNSIDALSVATVKDLSKIKGIKKKKAKEILKEIEEQSDWATTSENEFIESDEEMIVDESLEEDEEIEKKEKIQIFDDFSNIDEETGVLLYDNGYTTTDSLMDLTIKTLIDIGVKKRKAKKVLKEIEEKLILPIEKEIFEEPESEQIDGEIEKSEESIIEEVEFFEEENEDIPEIKAEEIKDAFEGINSIDDKISNLLLKNGITSIQDLNNMTIKDLTKIKGIRKKIAKQIKKEVNEHFDKLSEDAEKQMDFDEEEWESIPEEESVEGPVFMHEDYTLYEKEIVSKSGNKRVVRFFSKGEPEGAKAIGLPKGYKVRKNKKTGVPYLKKDK